MNPQFRSDLFTSAKEMRLMMGNFIFFNTFGESFLMFFV